MKWKIKYYNKSVADDVDKLEKSVKARYLTIVDTMLEEGPNLGMPFTRAMGKGLFEIRAKGQAGIARGFFCMVSGNTFVILHVFVKKLKPLLKKNLKLPENE